MIPKNVLVFDIETDGLDTSKCNMKSFHAYSYKTKEYYNLFEEDIQQIKEILIDHHAFVTFNGDQFDIPILERILGLKLRYNRSLDLLKLIRKRESLIRYKGFKSKSLANVCKVLGLEELKQEGFDYTILQQDSFTQEEKALIIKYGKQDIKTTKSLFEYLYKYFYFYKDHISKKDNDNWAWLMTSPGTYAYKAVCHLSGIKEEWPSDAETEANKQTSLTFPGGYVSKPSSKLERGKIYCLDFNSAYPHAYMMMNLFGYDCTCCTPEEKFTGTDIYKLNGAYCTKKLNPISETIKKLYHTRLKYKKNKDPREVALKIILNTLYGICGNPTFKNVFNLNTAKDCTLFVRETLKYARNEFDKMGYRIIYSDTDSIYLADDFNDEKRLMKVKDKIIKKINEDTPFPQSTYDLGIDDRIKFMFFPGEKKKSYLYLNNDNKVVIKGLPLIKNNASHLSMVIFKKYIEPIIIKDHEVLFNSKQLYSWIKTELENDITLAGIEWKVDKPSSYKNKTQIQYQIAEEYGKGIHLLIPNIRGIGIGKAKSYCTIDEFKKYNIKWNEIDLEKTYSELQIFTEGTLKQIAIKIKSKNGKKLMIPNTLGDWIQ